MRKGYCLTSEEGDGFVGVRFVDDQPEVVFPLGYDISDDESERRKDVFRLLSTIIKFSDHKEGEEAVCDNTKINSFPLLSFQYIINDYLKNGYYVEKESKYINSNKGKINWKRTINLETPHVDHSNIVYLDFQVKQSKINENNLITNIHKYCVYKSFYYFGWLYFTNSYLPQKPPIKKNKSLFLAALQDALNNTFNDEKKKLFQCMIKIIQNENDKYDITNTQIGVKEFAPIWEKLVNYTFGEENIDKYYPHGFYFNPVSNKNEQSSELRPDTIMRYKNNIYVLDAKYYKYGLTGELKSLPATESLQKQVTYGKYIHENIYKSEGNNVYNAFVLPYKSKLEKNNDIRCELKTIGTVDWEKYNDTTKNYAYILCLVADTKDLIDSYTKHNNKEIENLVDLIETNLSKNKEKINNLYK